MLLPNKLYSYEKSSLALVPKVLKLLEHQTLPVLDVYRYLQQDLDDVTDFMSVMDCLYALNAVDLNEKGEVYLCLSK